MRFLSFVFVTSILGCQGGSASQTCARPLSAVCKDGGACPPDWISAVAAAKQCKGGLGQRVFVGDRECGGVRVVFECFVDSCTYYEYDAFSGKLVAVAMNGNNDMRCEGSDLAPGTTPLPSGGMSYTPSDSPQCSWGATLTCCSPGFPGMCSTDASVNSDR